MFTSRTIQKSSKSRLALLIIATFSLAGCSTTTHLSSVQRGTVVHINDKKNITPAEESISDTTFGSYDFLVVKEGYKPLYGNLPRKFNGTYLTLDILFFTPLAFFNLNKVYHYYEFDLEKQLVKYKNNESDSWRMYKPSVGETISEKNSSTDIAEITQDAHASNTAAVAPIDKIKNPPQIDTAESLKKLKELHDGGLISNEEYNHKRAKIIEAL
jgi:hypothetical protein